MKFSSFSLPVLLAIFLVAFAANVNSKTISPDPKKFLSDIQSAEEIISNDVSENAIFDVQQESSEVLEPISSDNNDESLNEESEEPPDAVFPHASSEDNDPESSLKPDDSEEPHHRPIHPSHGPEHAHDIKIKHIQRFFRHLFDKLGKLVGSVIEDVSNGGALRKKSPKEDFSLPDMYPESKSELMPSLEEQE